MEKNISTSPLYYGDKESKNFRLVTLKDNDKTSYAVADKFGNMAVPFFDERMEAVVYATNKCFVVGRENDKTRAYDITFDNTVDGTKSKIVKFPHEIFEVYYINPDRLLFNTSNGYCFVSPNYSYLPVSDYYDVIYYCDEPRVNCWLYEKNISSDKLQTTMIGKIDLDGKVGSRAYDSLFNKKRDVYVHTSPFDYDIIEEFDGVREDLVKEERKNSIKKYNRVKRFIRKEE